MLWSSVEMHSCHTQLGSRFSSAPAHMFSIINERFLSELKLFYTAGVGENSLRRQMSTAHVAGLLRKEGRTIPDMSSSRRGKVLRSWKSKFVLPVSLNSFSYCTFSKGDEIKAASQNNLRSISNLWTLWSMVSSGHLRQHRTSTFCSFQALRQSKQGSSKGSLRNS